MVVCSLCASHFPSLSFLLTHIRLVHADQPNFQIQCNMQGCSRTFRKFTVYRNHLYQFHDTQTLECTTITETEDDDSSPLIEDTGEGELISTEIKSSSGISCKSLQTAAARWILKTSECHKIPQSVMDGIITDLDSLFGAGSFSLLNIIMYLLSND